ncbi:MAG: M28 family peptidase [Pseudomonadota bacterium]
MARPFLLMAAFFAAIMCAGLVLTPDPVRAHSGADQFDANTAHDRLARILGDGAPHPMDSANEDALRERLLTEIRALGYTPHVDTNFTCSATTDGTYASCGAVQNIWFGAGPKSGPAVLAAAHYDSVPAGPGASDDGMGVAAWLEAARALRGETLRRRVIFLLSDGEEPGLIGAHAFAHDNPLYGSIEAVVNLDVRGTGGPVTFFETSRPNGDAVRAYGLSAERPLANSIMAAVYEMLPNSTDVTALRRDGLDIVNMAVIDNLEYYHTPRDALATQDRASLQQMGDQGLAVLRALAMQADGHAGDNLVFTDIASRGFMALPETFALVVLGIAALVALAFFWLRAPKPRIRAFATPFVALFAAGLLSFVVGWGLSHLRPDYWHAYPAWTRAWTCLVALFAFALVTARLAKGVSAGALVQAGAAWFALIGFAGSLALPGLSILFLPASLFYALGALISLAWRPAWIIGAVLAALLALLLWAPLFALVESALGYDIASVESLVIGIMLLPLFGWLLLEQKRRRSVLAAGAAMLVAIVGAGIAPAYSPTHPRALNFLYLLDADAHEAHVVASPSGGPLPAEIARESAFSQTELFPWDERTNWATPASSLNTPVASASVISDAVVGGKRIVRLKLEPNGAYATTLRIPMLAHPISATLDDVNLVLSSDGADDDFVVLACWGRSCADAEVVLTLGTTNTQQAASSYVTGYFLGLPPSLQHYAAARPDWVVPIQTGDGVYTFKRAF